MQMARGECIKGDTKVGFVKVYQWLPCSHTHQDPERKDAGRKQQMARLQKARTKSLHRDVVKMVANFDHNKGTLQGLLENKVPHRSRVSSRLIGVGLL